MPAVPLKVVFLGSDPIALPLLEWIGKEGSGLAQLVAVYTQPDRAVGRGQRVQANAIKTWAQARGLPVQQPEKLTEPVRAEFAALGADVALVMAYGHILKDDFIATPRLGTLNFHASLLPKYRGASPIQTAIASGERETGVSLMRIVRRLDAGPVADVERVPISPRDTAAEIEAALAAAGVPLLARALPKLRDGSLTFVPQDEPAATYCRRLAKDDGALDFSQPAAVLAARINGLHPWPGCSVEINGQPVKFGLAEKADSPLVAPGESAAALSAGQVAGSDAAGLLIRTGQGALRVRRLQRPGGRMLEATDFLRGFPMPVGSQLPSRPMPVLSGPAPLKSS